MSISKDAAAVLAAQGLKDLHRDPDRYEVTVSESGTEWQVTFAGRQPRPPGDEVTFYIDKQSGSVRHMLGE